LREGAAGRLRLHRVLPSGASPAVTIETLATIAYTAFDTLAREETTRQPERAAPQRGHGETGPPRDSGQQAKPLPEAATIAVPETPPVANLDDATTTTEELPAIDAPSPDKPRPGGAEDEGLVVMARAAAPAPSSPPPPLRLSLPSFSGYRTGNTLTADRLTEGAWGMGIGVVAALLRVPLEPALGIGLGTWYGTGHDPFGSGTTSDGGPRPAAGPQLQGQAELRLTMLRLGPLSGSLGPWLTVSRATTDFGPTMSMGPRNPGQNQGQPPNQGQDPSGTAGYGATRVTRTEVSAGVSARLESELGHGLSLYLALAGATPLTGRPVPGDGRPGPGAPNSSGQSPFQTTVPRWTATAFAGLSIALVGGSSAF